MAFSSWYHPNIDGREAERLLMEYGVDGSFLVRPSTSFRSSTRTDSAISIRRGNSVIHIRIENDGDSLDLGSGEKFATLSELVEHYWKNKNQLRERSGELLTLRHPLPCADPTSGRWFHGFISRAQAEEELSTKGKPGSFLVRESRTQPGNYVLSVRIDESAVTHVVIKRSENGGIVEFDVGVAEKFGKLSDLVEHYAKHPMVEANGTVVTLKQPLYSTRMSAPSIKDRVAELNKASSPTGTTGFEEEFGALQQQESKIRERREGSRAVNRDKNRYKNVLPFDDTRVILHDADKNIDGDDYINANYIRSSELVEAVDRPVKTYIATQGCLSTTFDTFWRMIWQEKSRIIVNATKEMERGKSKCYKYWPSSKARPMDTHGPFTVHLIDEVVNDDFILRVLELQLTSAGAANNNLDDNRIHSSYNDNHDGGGFSNYPRVVVHNVAAVMPMSPNDRLHTDADSSNSSNDAADRSMQSSSRALESRDSLKSRLIYQYQFQAWPDHGVPEDPGRVLSFLDIVNEQQDKLAALENAGPLVVHCSAGIGRTGTFIVIDMLLSQITALGPNCEIDIYKTVQYVREQRSGMVQTEAQYRFIYNAVQKYIETERQFRTSRNIDKPYLNLAKSAADAAAAAAASGGAGAAPPAASTAQTNGSGGLVSSSPVGAGGSIFVKAHS